MSHAAHKEDRGRHHISSLGKRILVVDDEEHIAQGLQLNFELEGFYVDTAATGREAASLLLQNQPYDAIVLDVMLPDITGFEFCEKLRSAGNLTPILMLTARDLVSDRVTGIEAGADDYLTKPFELKELLARLRSLLRRRRWDKQPEVNNSDLWEPLGAAEINFQTHEARLGDQAIHLTSLEFDLLRYFFEHKERVLTRRELQKEVWNVTHENNVRMVDNFIVRLRRHFEADPADPKLFVSVRGKGYKFVPAPRVDDSP